MIQELSRNDRILRQTFSKKTKRHYLHSQFLFNILTSFSHCKLAMERAELLCNFLLSPERNFWTLLTGILISTSSLLPFDRIEGWKRKVEGMERCPTVNIEDFFEFILLGELYTETAARRGSHSSPSFRVFAIAD
nr:hypothetical protein Iba_chr02eCG2690 [Ipomoea batatas]